MPEPICTFQSIMYNEHITPTHYYIRHNINTFSTASAYLHVKKQNNSKNMKKSEKNGSERSEHPKGTSTSQ
ncbi:hypothetical protein [Methanobrevibacter sp.]|uniref:hypothetical protein n=1 Tax=Methanobrevibacter sp. TaxID=66852 RepID=UPI003864C3E1